MGIQRVSENTKNLDTIIETCCFSVLFECKSTLSCVLVYSIRELDIKICFTREYSINTKRVFSFPCLLRTSQFQF